MESSYESCGRSKMILIPVPHALSPRPFVSFAGCFPCRGVSCRSHQQGLENWGDVELLLYWFEWGLVWEEQTIVSFFGVDCRG